MSDAALPDASFLLAAPALKRVLDLLNDDGEEARVVGGAVRNTLLRRHVSDIDVATTALPAVVIARAKKAGLRAIPTGVEHGTVTLVVAGTPIEITTLREDVETYGRHAKSRFGRDFATDARRRDFTVNALSVGPDGVIHDYVGGIADLAAGRIRFIGDPATRIREDYLRILRFFRFSADYAAGDFDIAGRDAAIHERAGLAHLSRERIGQEILKLVCAQRAAFGVSEMTGAGLLAPLLQAVPQPARLARLSGIAPDCPPIPRLAATAALVEEDALRLRDALRLSNADAARISTAVAGARRFRGAWSLSLLREALFELGRQGAVDALRIAWAGRPAAVDDADWRSAERFLQDTPEPRLPFSGADLVARGIPAGRRLGVALKRLQADWIRAGFPQDPRSLAALLDDAVRGGP